MVRELEELNDLWRLTLAVSPSYRGFTVKASFSRDP